MFSILVANAASAADGWRSYRDDAHDFSIRIPPGWTVDRNFVDYGYGHYQGEPDDEIPGVAFRPAAQPQPDSDMRDPYPFLAVQTLPAGTKCVANSFFVDPPPDYFTEEPADAANFALTLAKPGDLYAYEEQVFVISTTPCLAAHIYFAYTQRRDKTERPVDRDGLSALFARIRRTIVVRIP